MNHRNALIAVTALVLISVICRIPYLTKPLDAHDWLTVHSLLTIAIWNSVGLQQSHYSLPLTYPNLADKYVSGLSGMFDSEGNFYFISFPPFAFLLAFFVL